MVLVLKTLKTITENLDKLKAFNALFISMIRQYSIYNDVEITSSYTKLFRLNLDHSVYPDLTRDRNVYKSKLKPLSLDMFKNEFRFGLRTADKKNNKR